MWFLAADARFKELAVPPKHQLTYSHLHLRYRRESGGAAALHFGVAVKARLHFDAASKTGLHSDAAAKARLPTVR